MYDYFRYEAALRGGGDMVILVGDGTVECNEISLRTALPTDPPILLNLPGLLSRTGLREAA
jgi:hypothetical protein